MHLECLAEKFWPSQRNSIKMYTIAQKFRSKISPEQVFMITSVIVNAGNYLYNLLLGRLLGPERFADAAIMVTLLLVISFAAMTFQLVVTKFTIALEHEIVGTFLRWIVKRAFLVGCVIGAIVVAGSKLMQDFFNTGSSQMFIVFGCFIPFYFLLSVNRGRLQGSGDYNSLSLSYFLEMLVRFVLTFAVLYFTSLNPAIAVAIGIAISFVAAMFPYKRISFQKELPINIPTKHRRKIVAFFMITLLYECTQIICNNSDILLVKHHFEDSEAGLYSSLALIGRVVYFVTWMYIMLLLPKVVELKKIGSPTRAIFLRYLGRIGLLCSGIVFGIFLFPELAVTLLFGKEYLVISPLLGWYAICTSLFAISNLFAYYFLSLDNYWPIALSFIMGLLQIGLIEIFHDSLFQVVMMQLIAMGILLIGQILFFTKSHFLLNRNTITN